MRSARLENSEISEGDSYLELTRCQAPTGIGAFPPVVIFAETLEGQRRKISLALVKYPGVSHRCRFITIDNNTVVSEQVLRRAAPSKMRTEVVINHSVNADVSIRDHVLKHQIPGGDPITTIKTGRQFSQRFDD